MSPRTLPILVLCVPLLGACDLLSGVNGSEAPLEFENIERAEHLDVRERQTVVFRTETEWVNFWKAHVDSLGENKTPSPPEIDFDQNMVLGLFWGRTSGCTSMVDAIQTVRLREKNVVVHVDDWTNGRICMALVQPRQVVKTTASHRPVRFEGAVPCPPLPRPNAKRRFRFKELSPTACGGNSVLLSRNVTNPPERTLDENSLEIMDYSRFAEAEQTEQASRSNVEIDRSERIPDAQ